MLIWAVPKHIERNLKKSYKGENVIKIILGLLLQLVVSSIVYAEILSSGDRLQVNQSICSDSKKYCLILQADNNLVLYESGSRALWSSGTSGTGAITAIMQEDGNFVLYTPEGKAVWSTQRNNSGSYLSIQDDGNIVLYYPKAIWQSGTSDPAVILSHATQKFGAGANLVMGGCYSIGQYCFVLQTDGNLVLYKFGVAIWSSKTNTARFGIMQSDGNFVLYDDNSRAVWATNTQSKTGAYFAFQGDGNLVIYSPTAVWDRVSESTPTPIPAPPNPPRPPRPGPGCGTINPFLECNRPPTFPIWDW